MKGAAWAGKVLIVRSVYRIRAVSSAAAGSRGSVHVKKDGVDYSAIKVGRPLVKIKVNYRRHYFSLGPIPVYEIGNFSLSNHLAR